MADRKKKPGKKHSKFYLFLGKHPALRIFLIAFGCCIVVFGILAVVMISSLTSPTSGKTSSVANTISIPTPASSSHPVVYSDKDSFNLLLVTYDDSTPVATTVSTSSGAQSQIGMPATIAVVRLDAANNRFAIWQVPLEQAVPHDGTNVSAALDYKNNGVSGLSGDLAKKVGITIGYTCVVPFSKLSLIMNTLSGLQYTVPSAMSYTGNDLAVHQAPAGPQLLQGDGVMAMLGVLNYGSTSVDKYNMQAALLKAFLQAKFSGTYLTNASSVYNVVLSYTQTNFYVTDITSRLSTLQRVTSQGGDYIKILQPTYIPVVQGNASVFDIDQSTTDQFSTFLGAK